MIRRPGAARINRVGGVGQDDLVTRIFDNIKLPLGRHLQTTLTQHQAMDVATGYFNLRGWRLFDELVAAMDSPSVDVGQGQRPRARILIGMLAPSPQAEALDLLQSDLTGNSDEELGVKVYRERAMALVTDLRQQLQRGRATAADRATLQSLRELLEDGKVEIRAYTRRPLHGKGYIFHRADANAPITGFVGSSNLTGPGLESNYELNVDVLDFNAARDLADWFTDRWDEPFTVPITAEILDLIEQSWVYPKHPYEVFLKVCYDLSRDVRESVSEYDVPLAVAGQLLTFQGIAVRTLARRLMSGYKGAMLGDVVGLGKTIVAISVALVLREQASMLPLVVCPLNLVEMWEKHLQRYGLPGRVVPYSMANQVLPTLPRYDLVIVDESHTLRNDKRRDYVAVEEYISRNAARTLLLTATPYNLRFRDVGNQLGLYMEDGTDVGLTPAAALALDPNLRDKVDGKVTTLGAFKLSEEPEDWRRLMGEHLVRRTRSFIQRNFAQKNEAGRDYLEFPNGTQWVFPIRDPRPIDHPFAPDDPAARMVDEQTLDVIDHLLLPRYSPLKYIDPAAALDETETKYVKNLTTAGGNVSGFVRTMFYKRLSSCGYSFITSLRRHVARNELWLYALDTGRLIPTGSISETSLGDDEADVEAGAEVIAGDISRRYASLEEVNPKELTWVRPSIFTGKLRDELEADTDALRGLLDWYGPWDQSTDSKLTELINLLTNVHPEEKVLIFSEYKDTARYIYESLVLAGIEDVGIATGESNSDPVDVARRFSPQANLLLGTESELKEGEQELRVLISTDVLSEGANLQSSHIVVNFDIPWAIIRLIQRAGRIDRVGQMSDKVVIYSMFHGSLDGVLDLRVRIAGRLAANAAAFGSDEKFFGTDEEIGIGSGTDAATIQGLYAGTLEDTETDEQVDAASLAYQYWLNATKDDESLAKRIAAMPDLVESSRAKRASDTAGGVAAFVRTQSGLDALGFASDDGELVLLTGQEGLRVFEASPSEPLMSLRADHEEFVTDLVRGPLAAPEAVAGHLRLTRKTIWNRLGGQLDLFDPDAAEAISAVYNFRLTDEAERRLRAAIRSGVDDMDLAVRIGALHREGQLVVESRSGADPIRIVSSMGVI